MLESYFSLIALKKELTQGHLMVHRAEPQLRISPFLINFWCWLDLLMCSSQSLSLSYLQFLPRC